MAIEVMNSEYQTLQFFFQFTGCVFQVNERAGQIIRYDQFYIPQLQEKVAIKEDFLTWLRQGRAGSSASGAMLSFCDYPFVFDAEAKTMLLHLDAVVQMEVRICHSFCFMY